MQKRIYIFNCCRRFLQLLVSCDWRVEFFSARRDTSKKCKVGLTISLVAVVGDNSISLDRESRSRLPSLNK